MKVTTSVSLMNGKGSKNYFYVAEDLTLMKTPLAVNTKGFPTVPENRPALALSLCLQIINIRGK